MWENITKLMNNIPEVHRLQFTQKLPEIYAEYIKTATNSEHNPGTENLESQSSNVEGYSVEVHKNEGNIVEQTGDMNKERKNETNENTNEKDESNKEKDKGNTENECRNEKVGTKNTEVAKSCTGTNKNNTITDENICRYYAKGQCRYGPRGTECSFMHPRKCRNWLGKGRCRFDTECRYFHPKLCKLSVNERKCYDLHCPDFHVRGTQRYIREEVQYNSPENFLEAGTNRGRNRQAETWQEYGWRGGNAQDWTTVRHQAHTYYTPQLHRDYHTPQYHFQNWTNHCHNNTPWVRVERRENYQNLPEVTHNMDNHSYLQTFKV